MKQITSLILFIILYSCTNSKSTINIDPNYQYDTIIFEDSLPKTKSNHADSNDFLYKNSIEKDSLSRDNYMEIIDACIEKVKKGDTLSPFDISMVIPTTEGEYLMYYSYTDPEKSEDDIVAFYKTYRLFKKYAKENKSNVFSLYIKLSEFVDGEYAESFFDDVPFVIEANVNEFCGLYPNLSKECQRRLKDMHKKYCK